ncbi:YraN family protein [Herbidospora mongoliensis]|uniref:YraN family protein n=1 Tax=Herbidospora mongoliensis TaxID=688067 RepID=UPI00082EC21F|nr:YraN family protein [Herbidospora mongoliensis]
MGAKDELGRAGEQMAATYLVEKGLEILDRNWRCRDGEIDIVAREGAVLVVVEVRTRSSDARGSAFASVTEAKLARLRRLGARWRAGRFERFASVRVDVVALDGFAGTFSVRWEKGVF